MSILKKIKLGLLTSVVMLSPPMAYAMISDQEEETGCAPQASPHEALFEGEETSGRPSAGDLKEQKRRKEFDTISSNMSPIYALLNKLEAFYDLKTSCDSEACYSSPKLNKSSRKEKKDSGGMGENDILISSPFNSNIIETPPKEFEEQLPVNLHKIFERLTMLRTKISEDNLKTSEDNLKDWSQLYRSFMDTVKIYQKYDPNFQIFPETIQRRHYAKRRNTMSLVDYKSTNSANEKKPISTAQGDPLILSLQDSPLFQRRHVREEESPSSSQPSAMLSPVSPRLMHGVSLPSLPLSLSSPRPSVESVSLPQSPPVPPRLPRTSEQSVSLPQSPPVPPRLPRTSEQSVSSPPSVPPRPGSFRPLPLTPRASTESASPPPLVPRRSRSLSVSPKVQSS